MELWTLTEPRGQWVSCEACEVEVPVPFPNDAYQWYWGDRIGIESESDHL